MALKYKTSYQSKLFLILLFYAWFMVLCALGFQLYHTKGPDQHIDWFFFTFLFLLGGIISIVVYHIVRRIARVEEEERNKIKRQLTNNINHELKTPVASIQVCIETLLTNKNLKTDKKQELLKHSYSHCERLIRLLSDVSLVTRLDEGIQNISKEEVNIYKIINDIKEEIDCRPDGQRIHIILNTPKNLIFKGSYSLIDSIFRNLIENAIAYSGGKNLEIHLLNNSSNTYKFVVQDDGIGVEEKHLEHLFERFYRVDKGRSRKLGGTGLGLSIVKHAVIFHGGSINVSNRHNSGLRFEFTLTQK